MGDYLYHKGAQLTTFVVLVLIWAGFWYLAVSEENSILGDSSARLDSEKFTLTKMDSRLEKTREIVENYRHNREEIVHFRETFLKRKEERIVRISEFLDEKAKEHRIRLERVQYDSAKTRVRDLDIYQTDLPLVGKYRDIRAFIDEIEGSDMFLIITRLTLDDDSAGRGAVRMQLSLATFFEGSHE